MDSDGVEDGDDWSELVGEFLHCDVLVGLNERIAMHLTGKYRRVGHDLSGGIRPIAVASMALYKAASRNTSIICLIDILLSYRQYAGLMAYSIRRHVCPSSNKSEKL